MEEGKAGNPDEPGAHGLHHAHPNKHHPQAGTLAAHPALAAAVSARSSALLERLEAPVSTLQPYVHSLLEVGDTGHTGIWLCAGHAAFHATHPNNGFPMFSSLCADGPRAAAPAAGHRLTVCSSRQCGSSHSVRARLGGAPRIWGCRGDLSGACLISCWRCCSRCRHRRRCWGWVSRGGRWGWQPCSGCLPICNTPSSWSGHPGHRCSRTGARFGSCCNHRSKHKRHQQQRARPHGPAGVDGARGLRRRGPRPQGLCSGCCGSTAGGTEAGVCGSSAEKVHH